MSFYDTKRQVEQYWKTPGNARLKMLLAAHPEIGNGNSKELARAYPGETQREGLIRHVPASQPRTLAKANYRPGLVGDARDTAESNVVRTLYDDDEDRKKILSGEKAVDRDRYLQRALANDSVTNLDVLFRAELMETIVAGAEPAKLARNMANTFQVNKRKGDHPRGPDQRYADDYSQGAEIHQPSDGFDTYEYETTKHAQAYELTNELVAESEPDVLEWMVRWTGAAVENKINRHFINALVDDADSGNDVDAEVDGTLDLSATQALNHAQTEIDNADFGPGDTAVVHPFFARGIFEDTNVAYAQRYGSDSGIQEREAQRIMGLNHDVASGGAYEGDNSFGYDSEDDIGAIVYPQEMAHLLIWMDLDMEDYDDPVRHLTGGNAYAYTTTELARPKAFSRVFHSTS